MKLDANIHRMVGEMLSENGILYFGQQNVYFNFCEQNVKY